MGFFAVLGHLWGFIQGHYLSNKWSYREAFPLNSVGLGSVSSLRSCRRDGNCKRLCQGKQEDVWLNIAVAGRPTLPIPSPQQDVCLHISMAGKPTLPSQQVFVKDICLHIAHQLTPWCRTFALWNHGVGREDPLVTVLDVCTTAGWRMWLQLYKRTAPTSIERKNISPTGLATNRTVGTLQLQGGSYRYELFYFCLLLSFFSLSLSLSDSFVLLSFFSLSLWSLLVGMCWWANKVPWRLTPFWVLILFPRIRVKPRLRSLTGVRQQLNYMRDICPFPNKAEINHKFKSCQDDRWGQVCTHTDRLCLGFQRKKLTSKSYLV